MDRSKHIAFIGLGVMGGPMTGHLARAGYTVTAYNRSPDRARKWAELWAEEGLAVTFESSLARRWSDRSPRKGFGGEIKPDLIGH